MKVCVRITVALMAFGFMSAFNAAAQMINAQSINDNSTFSEIRQAANNYFKDKDITKKGIGWKQFKRWEYFWEHRLAPDGKFPRPDILMEGRKQKEILRQSGNKNKQEKIQSVSGAWTSLGPTDSPGGYAGLGRLNCVRINGGTIWVGAAVGGVWKSTNNGATWATVTDDLAAISVSDIAIHPTNSQIMYLATGDDDGVFGFRPGQYSAGVLKSTDGGATWNTTGLNWTLSQNRTVARILIDPNNPNTVFAAGNNGVYRTADAGVNWAQVHTGAYQDMEFRPGTPSTIYVSGNTVFRSVDGGTTWTQLTNGLPTSGIQRIALAVTLANTNYIYALIANNTNYGLLGVYRSVDGGTTWSTRSTTPNILNGTYDASEAGGQGWYDLCIAASPTNAEEVYTGGVNVWKSVNGGTNWTINTFWYNNGSGTPEVHADFHDLYFSGSNLYAGNDGGIYHTDNGGTTWSWLGAGLVITQYYKSASSATNAGRVIAGAQDNGTKLLNGGIWTDVIGGDGMDCMIDYTNANIIYGEYQRGNVSRSDDGGNNWTNIAPCTDCGPWVTPLAMHPANPQIIYYGGNAGIYRSTNRGTNWSLVSNAVTGARTLVIAPSDGNILYASSGSTLRKSTDGGTTWATISTGLPALTITSVAVSSASSQTLWVTFSGYTAASKVYKTTNSGTTWTNVTNSLPNIPANCIVYQNGSADYVYVGTDLGVFYRSGAMGDWAVFDTGLPNVIVNDLDIQYSTGRIRAATYGRGLWESDLVDGSTTPGLTLIAPNGGESWAPNTVQSILWSAPATVTNVKLEYSTNGGSSWTTVISSVSAAAGTHSWTVPAFQTAQALVRITSTTDASVTDNSNAAFTIAPCTPTYINACNSEDFINLVTFNTIAKVNSGCNGQANNYIFYSSDQTTIEKGQTYTISLQSGPTWEQFFAVWIDFNQNTTFEDAERVVLTNTRTISVVNVQIPIPMTAATGATRMRVRCRYDGAPANSCSQYEYGETEDYPITIVAPTPTTLTVKALLQGVWNEATQTQTLTPIGIELRSGGVDSTDNPSPISWSLTGTTLVARASGFCDAAGNVTVNFDNLPTGSYWIVVRHGGHLGVASRRRVSITAGGTVTYDFTDSGFKAFTKSSTVTSASGATTQGGDGKWVLRSGDLLLAAPSGVNANDYSPVTGNNGKTSFVPAP